MDFKKYVAEAIGTFWLVFGGVGSALTAAAFPQLGIGFLGVSFAFGLTVLTMAYSIGHISGCHLNPAVTLGLTAGGRFPASQALPYIIAQVVGGLVAGVLLWSILQGNPAFKAGGFASNGFGELSPGKYSLAAVFIAEAVVTGMFLFIIMGATHGKAPVGFAPIAIGLGLTLIHLILIPISNCSVNPARSTATVLFADTAALSQLWLFWVAPIIGGGVGGFLYRWLSEEPSAPVVGTGTPQPQ